MRKKFIIIISAFLFLIAATVYAATWTSYPDQSTIADADTLLFMDSDDATAAKLNEITWAQFLTEIAADLSGEALTATTLVTSSTAQFGGIATFQANPVVDDNSGDSPIITVTDGDNNSLLIYKADTGGAFISNNESFVGLRGSGDADDYLSVDVASNKVTLQVIGEGDLDIDVLDTADTGILTLENSDATYGIEVQLDDPGGYKLTDDNYIELDATADGMDDDEYNGIVIGGRNCGEGLTQWDTVRLANDADPWHQADADAAGEFPAIGLAVAACTDTNEAIILVNGIVRNEGWTGLTPGGAVYLSDTAGGVTQTAPSTSGDAVQIVGWALSDSEIYFDFSRPYLEVE